MKPILGFFIPLACFTLLQSAFADDTNEIWISAISNACGTHMTNGVGTLAQPYYGDFDYIIYLQTTNTTIHLLPGTYYTKGNQGGSDDLYLKADMKLIGAGIDVTIVKRDVAIHGNSSQEEMFQAGSPGVPGIEISDLTVDCVGTNGALHKVDAVYLDGNGSAVRRIKVINSVGLFPSQESFPIFVGSPGTVGGFVEECEVSSVQGNYCEAITFSGQTVVSKNRMLLTGNIVNGLQGNGSCGSIVRDNLVVGANCGFYTDTFSETNLTIVGNRFQNVLAGVAFQKGIGYTATGISIEGNVIELTTNVPSSWWAFGVEIGTTYTGAGVIYRDVSISGNTIKMHDNGVIKSPAMGAFAIDEQASTGVNFVANRMLNNTVDRSFLFYSSGSGNLIDENTDLSGSPVKMTNVTSGSSFTLNQTDGQVLVTATTCTGVTLANAWGFPGKEVVIVNQKASGNLTVSACAANQPVAGVGLTPAISPANSLPAGAITLTPHQSVRLVSDGQSNWVQE